MIALYKGCLKGYENYLFDDAIHRKISKNCAKYLFWKRT